MRFLFWYKDMDGINVTRLIYTDLLVYINDVLRVNNFSINGNKITAQ